MSIDKKKLRRIVEGALLAAGAPLSVQKLLSLFEPEEGMALDLEQQAEKPSKEEISATLEDIQADFKNHGFELKEIGTGWRFQVIEETAPWVSRLWDEKPQKYSRALLETLSLIAYRQPITRGDIESIRGVAVSSHIIKTLTEREWVKVVGHRDVPGRPALYATTREFLDYFNLKNLDELPSLREIQDIETIDSQFDFSAVPTSENETDANAENANEDGKKLTSEDEHEADVDNNHDAENTADENAEAEEFDEERSEKAFSEEGFSEKLSSEAEGIEERRTEDESTKNERTVNENTEDENEDDEFAEEDDDSRVVRS